jgi:endoglucanase
MKTVTGLLATILLLSTAATVRAQPKPVDAVTQNRRLGRGVNILGYDPIWESKAQGRFQAKYFRLLKEAGFNSVRVNLHAFRHMDGTNGWALRQSWFELLDWAVREARAQDLLVILDLHEFISMGEDPEENKDKFLAFWRQVSAHYQNASASVLFELLNEPSRKLTPALWNAYLREGLAIVREKNPTRTVIVGPAFYNSLDHMSELDLPAKDRNLIVTIHYYEPFAFTHQGAGWTDQKDKVGVPWLGTKDERNAIKSAFDKAAAWAKQHRLPIFLGEFGAYDKGPMESRARYIAAVARAAERHGWSWAYWQFDSDFILYDINRDAWVEPILRALIPKTASAAPRQ